ncbi:HAD family hydrolase [Catellatospora chokoriensis]|uniref:Hydrolase n=1 Tax=Catellatospora chokoriensis TaxID=310353 RepID=A0A8J3K7D4_9ACTN|nr:HAD family phosphatase [Catellatospora chokoriensis]GIF91563.1 hydrolase [Catellatospora chokoriensis]
MAMSTVVFDLGGVVCRYRPERRLQELSRISGRTPADVHRILYGSGFIGETELGQRNAEEIVSEIGARLGRPMDRSELEPAWLASFPVDEEVLELVGRTAVRHRTAILTNNDLLLREALLSARPDFADRFDDIVFSAEIHAVKPAAESFRKALSIMKAEPSQVLFIDDSDTNVAGALQAGLSAVRYQHAQQLANELERYHVLDD